MKIEFISKIYWDNRECAKNGWRLREHLTRKPMKRTRSETMSRVEDLRTCCELGNNRFLFRVHFLHQPFYRVSQKISTEFKRLRLTHWLLSGDMNLSIVALVDFLWFQANRNTFSLLFVSRQQAQWIKVVSNKFRMSSRCFNHFDLKKLKPGWRQAGARGQSGQEGRLLYCCGQEVDEYDQEGVCIVVVILWGWLLGGFKRWHYQARLSAR